MPGDTTSGFVIAGRVLPAPPGLDVTNFEASEVHRFTGRDRSGRTVNERVLHESVTTSVETTVRVLKRRKLGVHLIVAPDGRVTQHGDLAHDRLAHAGGPTGQGEPREQGYRDARYEQRNNWVLDCRDYAYSARGDEHEL